MSAKSKNTELNTEENFVDELYVNSLDDVKPLDQDVYPDFDNLEEVHDDENLNTDANVESTEDINETNSEELVDDVDLDHKEEISDDIDLDNQEANALPDHELASYVIGRPVESPIATEFDDEQELKYEAEDREIFNNPVIEDPEIGLNEIEGEEEPAVEYQEYAEEPIEYQEFNEEPIEYQEFTEEPVEYQVPTEKPSKQTKEKKVKAKELPKENTIFQQKTEKLVITGDSYSEKFSNLKMLVVKPSKKYEKLNFKLEDGFDHEANENKIIELESRVNEKTYSKTEFDTWLLKNYKLYKYKGTAKEIQAEYKKLSMGDAPSDNLFELKVKFQKAFIPSIFYDGKNGIVAKKLKDYLVTEYEGDIVPYSYLNEKQVDYPVNDLVYEDAVNQINYLDIKKKDNDEIKKIYFNEYCYTDSHENLNGSKKLKKAYYKMGLLSFILGLIIIALGVVSLIEPVVEYIKDFIDLKELTMPLFICGGSLCFILILYNCFKGPLSVKIKKLIRLKSKYLVFVYNNKRIDNAIYSILHAKVRTTTEKGLSKAPKSLCCMDYDAISSITAGQIQAAKMQRMTKRTSNSLVKWMGRIHSVLATTLFAGGIATLVDVIMTSFQSTSNTESFEISSLAMTYLAAFGVSVVLGLLFLVSRKKPILRKSFYYLHGLLVLVAVIVIKLFVL